MFTTHTHTHIRTNSPAYLQVLCSVPEPFSLLPRSLPNTPNLAVELKALGLLATRVQWLFGWLQIFIFLAIYLVKVLYMSIPGNLKDRKAQMRKIMCNSMIQKWHLSLKNVWAFFFFPRISFMHFYSYAYLLTELGSLGASCLLSTFFHGIITMKIFLSS